MTCRFCNGFYSNAYGQPVCRVCHNFLFEYPVEDEARAVRAGDTHAHEKDAAYDSGNEEAAEPPPPAALPAQQTDQRLYARVVSAEANGQSGHTSFKAARRRPSNGTRRKMLMALEEPAQTATPTPTGTGTGGGGGGGGGGNGGDGDNGGDSASRNYLENLPCELLVTIFSFCSDVALWSLYQTAPRFRAVIDAEVSDDQWRRYVQYRWPLFRPRVAVKFWRTLYGRLFASTPCRYCLERWRRSPEVPIEPESWRHSRVQNEVVSLRTEPPDGIEAIPLDDRSCHWQATIAGPPDSPYEGGLFFLHVYLPHSYPMRPPKLRFFTRIFHPNVSRHGEVGLDAVSHNWSLALTLGKILISVQSLLTDAYTHVCMEPAVGRLYMRDRAAFEMKARLWTRLYAMHDFLPPLPSLPPLASSCRYAEVDSDEEI